MTTLHQLALARFEAELAIDGWLSDRAS